MSQWITDQVVITHDVGLHARPSVKLTRLARGFGAAIEIAATTDGPWIDAKSIVKVMALKARQGSTLHLRASGADAGAALAAITALVRRNFDETAHGG